MIAIAVYGYILIEKWGDGSGRVGKSLDLDQETFR